MAAAQLAGEDFLVGLDRQRADLAGQQLAPVPGLGATTAAGLARRLSAVQWRAVETELRDIAAAALAALPLDQAAALCAGVTIDLDTTDVEVYGRHKRGVAYNPPGPADRPPARATWADTATVLAADLLAGNEDPRRDAPELLRRALAALPAAARTGRIRLRADAGYFAGQLARAALFADIEFAIGAEDRAAVAAARRAGRVGLDRRDRHARRAGRRRRLLSKLVARSDPAADPSGSASMSLPVRSARIRGPAADAPCTPTSAPCRWTSSPRSPPPTRSTATRSS
jgi:hypothetical protein